MGVSSFGSVSRRVGLLGVLLVLVSAGRISAVPPIATPDGYATQNGGTTGVSASFDGGSELNVIRSSSRRYCRTSICMECLLQRRDARGGFVDTLL